MREVIYQRQLTMLNQLKHMMLMNEDNIYVIKDFTFEKSMTVPRKSVFGQSAPKEKIYLTSINILGYNKEGKFKGFHGEDWCITFITLYNLYTLRDNWNVFKEQLQAFGFKIVHLDETVESAIEKEAGVKSNQS